MAKDKYTEKDAAEDTGASNKEVAEAWHEARDHAAEEKGWGVPEDRHGDDEGKGDSRK